MVRFKQIAEDFIVDEMARELSVGGGQYSYFLLRKKGLTTQEAITKVARLFRLTERDVGYAGAKDKRAVTSQMISIRRQVSADFTIEPDIAGEYRGAGHDPISLGDLHGNRFHIIIRDIAGFERPVIEHNLQVLERLGFLLPNYFDDQRFGIANVEIGSALLRKEYAQACQLIGEHSVSLRDSLKSYLAQNSRDYVGALRPIPRRSMMMFVHAVQSFLYNELLRAYIEDQKVRTASASYARGELLFAHESIDDTQIPVPGYGLGDTQISARSRDLLRQNGISEADFLNRSLPHLSVEAQDRSALMKVGGFWHGEFEADDLNAGKEKLAISFSLPKGSYATIVLKFLTAAFEESG